MPACLSLCVCVAVRMGSSVRMCVCVCCICLAVACATTLIRHFVHLPLAKLCNWLVFSFFNALEAHSPYDKYFSMPLCT